MIRKSADTIIAAALFAVVFIVYMLTVAPTISFWDTGEFITCAVTMGIPHPPGAPLLSLVGRVMSIIPFYDFRGDGLAHIAYRINLISVITGALTILLLFSVIVRLIERSSERKRELRERWPLLFAAALASLMAAFSHQFWENAIETETYMPSIFLSMLALWLTLKWEERKNDPAAIRYMFLAAYLIGLGIGVHLYVLLMVPAIALIVFFAKPKAFRDIRLWTGMFAMLVLLGLLRTLGGKPVLYILMGLTAAAGPFLMHRMYRKAADQWKIVLAAVMTCFALFFVGYSVYPTIPVRAAKQPSINEGAPDNWARFKDYLERKQYLPENMYTGMFTRKAPPSYQFGYMYARYLFQQFPVWGPTPSLTFRNDRSAELPNQTVDIQRKVPLSLLLWLLLLLGVAVHAIKDRRRFLAVIAYFLATSVGLVLYLNMANPEVRERDYFFLGSFLIVHVWLAFGIWGMFLWISDQLTKRGKVALVMPVSVAAAILLSTMAPAAILSRHINRDYTQYQSHDRSGDLIPLEYGMNILASCEKDAVLFTHGDNDTYPVWYAQEVLGFRKDIRVVNVSLLNGPWYAAQLRDQGVKLPLSLSDKDLMELVYGQSQVAERNLRWKAEGQTVTMAGISWDLPPSYSYQLQDGSKAAYLSASAWMTAYIIKEINWSRPIYFAVTIAPEALIGLEPYLQMEGMVFRLTNERVEGLGHAVAREALEKNINERYRFSAVDDPAVYKSPETRRLLLNYFVGYGELVKQYLVAEEHDKAIETAETALKKHRPDIDHRVALFAILREGGIPEKADSYMQEEIAGINYDSFNTALSTAMTFISYEFYNDAAAVFLELTKRYPNQSIAWKGYSGALFGAGKYQECLDIIDRILEKNPVDREALTYKQIILGKMEEMEK